MIGTYCDFCPWLLFCDFCPVTVVDFKQPWIFETLHVVNDLIILSVTRMNGLTNSNCPFFLLSSETTVTTADLESSGKEEPVELHPSPTLWNDSRSVELCGSLDTGFTYPVWLKSVSHRVSVFLKKMLLRMIDLCIQQSQMGSLAGTAHPLNDNASDLREKKNRDLI